MGQTNARTGYGADDPYAPSVANGQITPAQYAEYRARRRRDAILGSLLTIGGMSFAQPLANAIGIGATGAGAATGGGGGALASGALPPVSGGAPWAVTPYAGTAMSAPTGAAAVGGSVGAGAGITGAGGAGVAGGAGAGEAARTILGLSPRDLAAIAGSGISTIGALTADNPNTNLNTSTTDPQMKELLDLMMGRLRKSEPLHDSILAMADGLLPTRYQRGGQGRG